MKFGIQGWGVSDLVEKDAEGFFAEAGRDGFSLFEPCIWLEGEKSPHPALWDIGKLGRMAGIMKKHGFSFSSAHIFAENPLSHVQLLKEISEEYGIRLFAVKPAAPFTLENLGKQAESLEKLADAVSAFGGEILLHCDVGEVQAKADGMSAYEWLLTHTGGKIFAEADIGWLLAGGEDPEAFLWRNEDRIHALHFKDFRRQEDGTYKEVTVGEGDVDTAACFQFMRYKEIPGIADMDSSDDMAESLEKAGENLRMLTQYREHSRSFLNIYDIRTGKTETIAEYDGVIEAPNWLKDGDTLLYNEGGRIWKHSISRGTDEMIDSGSCDNCNNDHVPGPDNTEVAVSCSPKGGWESRIYIVPMQGGDPRCVVSNAPSFLHGWSPDGKELCYCAFRKDPEAENGMAIDIYVSPADGGTERALTHHQGMNDGPEYSPDGKKIWFISTRSGLMQVYSMNRDGSEQRQMTFEEQNNWFGHISPDGKKVVNIAYSKKGLDPTEHLPNMQVSLWLMNSDGTGRHKILDLFGGQGSINVNSWSQDSTRFAWVSYELLHK